MKSERKQRRFNRKVADKKVKRPWQQKHKKRRVYKRQRSGQLNQNKNVQRFKKQRRARRSKTRKCPRKYAKAQKR